MLDSTRLTAATERTHVRRRISRRLAWTLSAAWAGAIYFVSSQPGNALPGGYSVQGHLAEYFVLGALLTWALADDDLSVSTVALAILLASAYAVTDEFHQRFVVMRTPDAFDWLLDTVGATAGAFAARGLLARNARKSTGRRRRSTG